MLKNTSLGNNIGIFLDQITLGRYKSCSNGITEVLAQAQGSGSPPLLGLLSLVLKPVGRLAAFEVTGLVYAVSNLVAFDAGTRKRFLKAKLKAIDPEADLFNLLA